MTLQASLLKSLQKEILGIEVKKIDKDNFLDIHIPAISKAKATHLFFNTPKSGIKVGFYCRDEDFVKKTLKKSKKLEGYSQGIRLTNNPVFETPELAIKAALTLVELMTKEKVKKELKPTVKPKPESTQDLNQTIPKVSIPKKLKEETNLIPAPKKAQEVKPQEVQLSFWQRILNLFR